jgi:Acid Phosphatase
VYIPRGGERGGFSVATPRASNLHSNVRFVSSVALTEINKMRAEGVDICAGVASRTDEPGWAKFCMDQLVVEDGSTLSECFEDRVEISFENKKHHLQRLHRSTGVPFENMVFFDNEYSNISSVRSLGVRSFHTPNGMEEEHWREAKKALNI